jgi:hypothetical protein
MNSKKIMFKLNALILAIAMVCVCSFGFISCGDEDKSGTVHDPSKPIVLTSFVPDSGRISEMVLLDGNNFGTDTSKIRVFFNTKEARVLGSTGTRILALVPRLPGDTCILTVEVGDKKETYSGFFRYKIEASVITFAGNGNSGLVTTSLDKSQIKPVYIAADKDYNIFVSAETDAGTRGHLVRLNEEENLITVLATVDNGMTPRFQPNAHPETGVIMMGGEGTDNRDRFLFLDPKEGWAPKNHYIKNWITNDYPLPTMDGNTDNYSKSTHYHCLYCRNDGYLYTRYNDGHLVKIDSKTWDAEIVYRMNSGVAYGMAFNPVRTYELWIAYEQGQGGELSNSLCRLDIRDPAGTFQKMSGATAGGHRDGKLEQAQFYQIRQMNFDSEGNLYIGDSGNHCIRKLDTNTLMVETVVGIPQLAGFKDGKKEDAQFKNLHGIAVDPDDVIFASDYGNYRVRRIAIE